jgi:hypothetical protein
MVTLAEKQRLVSPRSRRRDHPRPPLEMRPHRLFRQALQGLHARPRRVIPVMHPHLNSWLECPEAVVLLVRKEEAAVVPGPSRKLSVAVKAEALRRALSNAISKLPTSDDPFAKREAARQWRREIIRRAFNTRRFLTSQESDILLNLIPGRALDARAIEPEIIPCRDQQDFLIFSYFSLCSSFPTVDRPGRRMKFLIRDQGHRDHPLIGICCLSSPVRQLRVRDEWIGWQASSHRATRARNLVYVSDLCTCISLPPYSFLTGGKLIAGLMASDETRSLYYTRYHNRLTLRQSLRADELYLLTTSGCYGSNSPQYKGIRCEGRNVYKFLGYSKGYSHFQIDPLLYEDVKQFVRRRRPETNGQFRLWSNSKIRVLRIAARELNFPEELLVFTGHRRAVFAAPLAQNWRELLLGHNASVDPVTYPAAKIIDYWRQSWLSKRIKNCIVTDAVKKSLPEDIRISRLLESRNG